MLKEVSPRVRATQGGSDGSKGINPQCNTAAEWYLNYESFYSRQVYDYVSEHPGCLLMEIQQGCGCKLHYNHHGRHWERLLKIADTCEALCFFGVISKEGYRFYPTGKQPKRQFGSDGMPRVQLKSPATCPGYGHPDCGGDGE
jgi:hypothetical protein